MNDGGLHMSVVHSRIGTHPGWLAFKTDGSATRLG